MEHFLQFLFFACVPDLVNHTPTPTIQFDAVAGVPPGGFRIWELIAGVPFLRADFPCWQFVEDEELMISRWVCRGIDTHIPVQRFIATELDWVDLQVTAYNSAGESPAPSNVVSFCMPDIWDGPPQAYQ